MNNLITLRAILVLIMLFCVLFFDVGAMAEWRTTSSQVAYGNNKNPEKNNNDNDNLIVDADEEPIIIENHQELIIKGVSAHLYLMDRHNNIKYIVNRNKIVAIQNIRPHNEQQVCRIYLGTQYIDFIGDFDMLNVAYTNE